MTSIIRSRKPKRSAKKRMLIIDGEPLEHRDLASKADLCPAEFG